MVDQFADQVLMTNYVYIDQKQCTLYLRTAQTTELSKTKDVI